MISLFVLLTLVGGVCRLGLAWGLRRKFAVSLWLPAPIALGIMALAALPDMIAPVNINLPLGLVVGLLLPDVLLRRAW